nr:MAG TPA: hypothetical protein [Caudoviricetes sp.]
MVIWYHMKSLNESLNFLFLSPQKRQVIDFL